MMDGNTSPLSSPEFHSFENLAHCYEERERWCHITTLGDWLGDWVDCDQRKVNRLERSDNNSQSSGWLTLPAFSPGTWLA